MSTGRPRGEQIRLRRKEGIEQSKKEEVGITKAEEEEGEKKISQGILAMIYSLY